MGNCSGKHYKRRICCCRCGTKFDLLGDLEGHSYLEYLRQFGRDLPPTSRWRCYGCLREYSHFGKFYGHFRKTWARVTPDDNPRFLNLLPRYKSRYGKGIN